MLRDPSLRGLLSSGLLLLAVLLSVAVLPSAPDSARGLAAVAVGAVLVRAALATDLRTALGPFADALDLGLGLALALCALALTGGLASELYVLLLVDLVLARVFLGAAASRFLALATLLGLGLLVAAPAAHSTPPALGLLLRGLWPLAVLAALELWEAHGHAAVAVRPLEMPTPLPARAAAEPAAARLEPNEASAHDKLLHDLRSPLTVFRLYADVLDEQARKGKPPLLEHVANLRAEIEMMQALLAAHGRTAPPAAPETAPGFDLLPLLRRLAGTYRVAHEGRVRIAFESDAPGLSVAADPLAVRRAVRNVLDNAVKFTPPGGEVKVRAGRAGGDVFVVVSDTGLGVSDEEREKVFDFNYRGEAARAMGANGSGLGLGLTRELIEAHGGRITLASHPGRGSEVTILLPAA